MHLYYRIIDRYRRAITLERGFIFVSFEEMPHVYVGAFTADNLRVFRTHSYCHIVNFALMYESKLEKKHYEKFILGININPLALI